MMKPLTGIKVAVLVANGFDEASFLKTQKMMVEMGATMRIISTNQGLVNGWEGQSWGHNYAVDAPLNTALGVDYSALVIPGGSRSLEKLKLTAHTRRFIGSFMASEKPVCVMGDAVMLMAMTEQLDGRMVTGPEECREMCTQAAAKWDDADMSVDNNLLTGLADMSMWDDYASTMKDMMMQYTPMDQAA